MYKKAIYSVVSGDIKELEVEWLLSHPSASDRHELPGEVVKFDDSVEIFDKFRPLHWMCGDVVSFDNQVWVIARTRTSVTVLWQDGSREENLSSISLHPVPRVEDDELWPGDAVHDGRVYGTVQSVDRAQQSLKVRWFNDSSVSEIPTILTFMDDEWNVDIADFVAYTNSESVPRSRWVGQVLERQLDGQWKVLFANNVVQSVDPNLLMRVTNDDEVVFAELSRPDLEAETTSAEPLEALVADLKLNEEKVETNHERLIMSDSAVHDNHSFAHTIAPSPHAQTLRRLQKEYQLMKEQLPTNIQVVTYESRTDLLRALIFGSPETPYDGLCLVVDIHTDANYPVSPPTVKYHPFYASWPSMLGSSFTISADTKLNPNLNADGTVCLSLLNTFAPSDTSSAYIESWTNDFDTANLTRVLMSLSGLVLGASQPWFNEDGWWRLVPNRHMAADDKVSSLAADTQARAQIYHERTYLLVLMHIDYLLNGYQAKSSSFKTRSAWLQFRVGNELMGTVLEYYERELPRLIKEATQRQWQSAHQAIVSQILERLQQVKQ
jgi:ubiquitin-protein ligase